MLNSLKTNFSGFNLIIFAENEYAVIMMPELPDLENYALNLEKRFKNKVLERLEARQDYGSELPVGKLTGLLTGHQLKSVQRNGQNLQLCFKNHEVLEIVLIHEAELSFLKPQQVYQSRTLVFHFKGGEGFVLKNFQKKGVLILNPLPATVPDAVGKELDYDYLTTLCQHNQRQIKTVLMDQEVIRGLGSAYVDEVLWHARISPFSVAAAIPESKVRALLRTIKYVLIDAVKEIRRAYPEHLQGTVKDFMAVHFRNGEKSPGGSAILVKKAGTLRTYYTAEQVLYLPE